MQQQLSVDVPGTGSAASKKKFGTFLGVYTPSVLTILGVIMYQRFGWVVGHAGLGQALLIVLLAHVISVTTGLSVASIATNHTVKTGGNYYIISRSLGLSIGGAIGVALYLALTLGVSLYLIGFSEALLAATAPWSPTGDPRNDIRLVGSVACVAIALLTLYSTDFALKSQLFVLGAIALSLVSIFAGSNLDIGTETKVGMAPPPNGLGFETVFAVFFPAVTGFTAGVGMSGDLKDPKRAIPIGTMAAIVTGMVIYLVLPPFLARVASVEQLQTNNNILLKIAWIPELVTLGVFSATLSSALGSILGAPRTLQALAFDGIVPRFLGRGRDEPRLALLVTLLIAEAGILVGQLELVGAVISMFFLTSYGFLCLACGLERWASPDFRPQFRVPIWVSLLGAVAAFMVMAQIDALAMLGAISMMAVLYFFLKRRQLVLASGDTWGGVWSAVVRIGLMRLRASASRTHTRNWRPNMVVMSRTQYRAATIQFARGLVGDRGILTHFDLIAGSPMRSTVDEALEREYPGMFARKQGVENVYDTIPNVAANFGLAGMETNTILIGWPRRPEANTRYGQMIGRLVELDLSVLMLRYDHDRGFGKRQQIDVWWDGVAPTGQLLLTLAYLLKSAPAWKNARVRVLVTGRPMTDPAAAQKRLERIINQARVQAEAVVLAPLAGDLGDRIRQESAHADLVMIHALPSDEAGQFVAANQPLLKGLGTALLVRPAPGFDNPYTVFPPGEASSDSVELSARTVTLNAPVAPALEPAIERLEQRVRDVLERFISNVNQPSVEEERAFLTSAVREVEDLRQVERRLGRRGGRLDTARGLVEWARNRYASAILARNQAFMSTAPRTREEVPELQWTRRLREGIDRLQRDLETAAREVPVTVAVPTAEADWAMAPEDDWGMRLRKKRVRIAMRWFKRPPPDRKVPTRRVALRHLGPSLWQDVASTLEQEGVRRLDAIDRIRRLSSDVDRCFGNLSTELERFNDTGALSEFRESVAREIAGLSDVAAGVYQRFEQNDAQSKVQLQNLVADAAHAMADDLARRDIERVSRRWSGALAESAVRRAQFAFAAIAPRWTEQISAMANALDLDLRVSSLAVATRRGLYQLDARVRREVEQGPLTALSTAVRVMRRVADAESLDDEVTPGASANGEATPAATSADGGSTGHRTATGPVSAAPGSGAVPAADGSGSSPPSGREAKASGAKSSDLPKTGDVADPTALAVRRDYLAAADELRATWEAPYRPVSQQLLEQLVGALGRAAEGLPRTVTTVSEAAMAAALDGQPSGAQASYPARRLVQTFLDQRVVQPTRALVTDLPPLVESAQEVLFDAVRLVAFELEQASGDRETEIGFEDEPADVNALSQVIEPRILRLEAAAEELRSYLDRLRTTLRDDLVPAVSGARAAAVGSPGRSDPTARAASGPGLGWRVRAVVRATEDRVGAAVRRLIQEPGRVSRGAFVPPTGDLVDDIAALRASLLPNGARQVELPLLYRRIFGRSALEKSDLLRGRSREAARLERAVERWNAGTGGPLAIIGEPRSGRTSLASFVSRELMQGRTIVRVVPPVGGGDDVESVNAAVVAAVGGREGQGAEGALRSMPPGAVVLVDEIGRWMSRAPGGLDGLRLWQRLWRRLGERHLFVVVATPYTWRYASHLLTIEQGFLGIAECGPIRLDALKELLMLRQRTADFELAFERIGWGPLRWPDSINERRQLSRLHERSRGNVGDALDLWRRSVVGATERRITLHIAPAPDASVLSRLPLRWTAALTAIAFHRAVSPARLANVLRVGREEALALVSELERAQLIASERSGAWGLDPVMQPKLLRMLYARGGLG